VDNIESLLSIPLVEAEKKLFLRRDFSFIVDTEKGENKKQCLALELLTSGQISELLYGGAAGGAKSWTGATWLTFMCECYAGTRWFVGRDSLTDLRNSTYLTFQKVSKAYGIEGVV
jgi:phage terminase large subunit